jgi:hypothetical protein
MNPQVHNDLKVFSVLKKTNLDFMKTLFLVSLLFGSLPSFSQQLDSIPTPKNLLPPKVIPTEKTFDLKWADSLINEIASVHLVQLRPECPDQKLLDTFEEDSILRMKNCFPESVIREGHPNFNRLENVLDNPTFEGFDSSRTYLRKVIDTAHHSSIFKACFGKRESNVYNMCFMPRHAIFFLDRDGKTIAIYEICFECGNAKLATSIVESINTYEPDYKVLKQLFLDYGYQIRRKKSR